MATSANHLIEVHDLVKKFGANIVALDKVNLTIDKGEVVVIVGPSGSGKSTLLRSLNLLEIPTSGSVIFEGVDITGKKVDLNKHRQKMGMVFQHFNLFPHKTVLENMTLAPIKVKGMDQAEAEKMARGLLEKVGLADRADAYPAQLSGGQKQRIAIARALATNPKVLLCDEATSALDPNTTSSILALLKDINRRLGITIVIITHEMRVIEEICNRVAIISESKIAECGDVTEIFSHPKTPAAQHLVFPEGKHTTETFTGKHAIRIVFNGSSSFEPVIANMVLEYKSPVNILFADTKNMDGKAFGQIVIQLPEDESLADKMQRYLHMRGLTVEEVSGNVG